MAGGDEDLGRRIARSAAWSVLLRLSIRSLGLISTLVLVRILLPEDFGLVAMASVVIGILEFIFDFSFTQFLIRERSEERSLYDTVWTLSVIRSLIIGGLIIAGAPLTAEFYADSRLIPVFWILAISTAISGFENVGTVEFQKKLQFQREFRYRGSTKLISFVVTIVLALSLRSYWALVWGMLASQAVLVALSYCVSVYRPRFDLSQTRRIFGFSLWFMLASIFGAFLTRSAPLVLGRLSGPESVGFFEVGREVAELPTTELVWPIARALFPGYALAAGDMNVMRRLFLDSTAITLTLAIPLALGIAATADLVVRIALGTNWLPAIPVIKIMAVCGLVRLSYSGSQSIIMSMGKPSLYAYLAIFSCVATIPPMLFGAVNHGLAGTAIGYLGGIVLSAIACQISALRLLGIGMAAFWGASVRSITAGLVMYGVVSMALPFLLPLANGVAGYLGIALLAVVSGAAIYAGALLGFWRLAGSPAGGEQILRDEIRKRLLRHS